MGVTWHQVCGWEKVVQLLFSASDELLWCDNPFQMQVGNEDFPGIQCLLAHHFGFQIPSELFAETGAQVLLNYGIEFLRICTKPGGMEEQCKVTTYYSAAESNKEQVLMLSRTKCALL